MIRYDFNSKEYDEIKVICKNYGKISYCCFLAVNGLCKCNDFCCDCAVAVLAKKDGYVKYFALENIK